MDAKFTGDLNLKFLKEPVDKTKWFMTISTFYFTASNGQMIRVPIGTFTDFASIPIGFRNVIARFGRHGQAAVLHDHLCKSKVVSRKRADDVFLEAMKCLGVGWLKRRTMYLGVRAYSLATFKK